MKITILALCLATTFAACGQSPTPTPTPAPDYANMLKVSAVAATPAPPAPAQTAKLLAAQSAQLNDINFRMIGQMARELWANPVNAQAILDAMDAQGTPAAAMLAAYGGIIAPLSWIDPVQYKRLPQPPAGYGWVIQPAPWLPGQRSVVVTTGT